MEKLGLVLEGGGNRGIYTAGVLDTFLDEDLAVDGVIGVSAGAIHGASYISKQKGRSIKSVLFETYTEKSSSQNVGYGQYLEAVSTSSLSMILRTSSMRFSTSSW